MTRAWKVFDKKEEEKIITDSKKMYKVSYDVFIDGVGEFTVRSNRLYQYPEKIPEQIMSQPLIKLNGVNYNTRYIKFISAILVEQPVSVTFTRPYGREDILSMCDSYTLVQEVEEADLEYKMPGIYVYHD